MYHLPEEIISYIYEYDNTYRELFSNILNSRYQIFQNLKTKSYFIFDLFSGKSFITDSFENPTWKTTHHTNRKKSGDLFFENFKMKMINTNNLKKVNDNLKYNIHEPLYSDSNY